MVGVKVLLVNASVNGAVLEVRSHLTATMTSVRRRDDDTRRLKQVCKKHFSTTYIRTQISFTYYVNVMLKKLNKDSLLIEDLVRVSDVSVECYASRLL